MSPYRSSRLPRRFFRRSFGSLGSLVVAAALVLVGACGASTRPQLKVLAVERPVHASRPAIMFVEVVNRDATPMRLQRLEYTFAAAGARHAGGEVELARVVEPGGAVVVEVPLPRADEPFPPGEPVTMDGRLYCEQDELVRSFPVTAAVPAESFVR